jgi:hypothetical protein
MGCRRAGAIPVQGLLEGLEHGLIRNFATMQRRLAAQIESGKRDAWWLEVVEPLQHAAALRCDLFQERLAAFFGAEGFGPPAMSDHAERAVAVGTDFVHVSIQCSGGG